MRLKKPACRQVCNEISMTVAYLTACRAEDGYSFYRTAIPDGIKYGAALIGFTIRLMPLMTGSNCPCIIESLNLRLSAPEICGICEKSNR
ncbi:MAG: hypothetical protein LBN71_00635 [Tannerella sp.]|jgi:hypothetical protein|nr:hypothetical protein [Tannerella sp.]